MSIPDPILFMLTEAEIELSAATTVLAQLHESGKRLGPRDRERVFRLLASVQSKAEQLKLWLGDS